MSGAREKLRGVGMRTIVACETCGFELWRPITTLSSSFLGLYSDKRFPGRCILSLDEHFDHFDALPAETMYWFMMDVRNSIAAIKAVTGLERVNTAILGNQEGHVHAHLIPRNPVEEPRPDKAPWEDPRERGPLDVIEEGRLVREIQESLELVSGFDSKFPLPPTKVRFASYTDLKPTPRFEQLELFGMMSEQ